MLSQSQGVAALSVGDQEGVQDGTLERESPAEEPRPCRAWNAGCDYDSARRYLC